MTQEGNTLKETVISVLKTIYDPEIPVDIWTLHLIYGVEVDEEGNVKLIHCTYDPDTFSGECERKVKGTIHWVPVKDAVPAEFRLYEQLMTEENVSADDFIDKLNPDSVKIMHGFTEPYIAESEAGSRYQFMRIGYFCTDPDSKPGKMVFNRTVGLKDSYKPNN